MKRVKCDFVREMDYDLLLTQSATSEAWFVRIAEAAL